MDLDLRLVRAFVVVAQTAHFGRAADRLHLAQSAVSRQVQRLEADLGVRLLERTSRSVRLTTAGEAFLPEAVALLDRAEAARRRVVAYQSVVLGFLAGLHPTTALRRVRDDGHDGHVQLSTIDWFDQADALHQGRVDVVLGRLPIPPDGLCIEPLWTEPRMVLLPAGHRLADRDAVRVADIADEPVVRHEEPTAPRWDAFWAIDPRPDGSRARWGPVVRTLEEKVEYIAAGEAVTVIPASLAGLHDRPDVRSVLLQDAAPSTTVVAWCDDARTRGRRHPLRDAVVGALRATVPATSRS